MADILLHTQKLKVFDALERLGAYAGEDREWLTALWEDLLEDPGLYEEFVYYLEHHELREKLKFEGYTLIDLFIWQMGHDNLLMDTGKNTAACNKERMVLQAFHMMRELEKNPSKWLKKLSDGRGMDKNL